MPDLCLTLACPDLSGLEEKIRRYADQAAFIEVRLDHLDQPQVPSLPSQTSSRFLATCRPQREGGRFGGEESERLRLLASAARQGFRWIDLEHDVTDPPPLPSGTRVVRSLHHFGGFPASLDSLFQRVKGRGQVAKLAVDTSTTLQLTWLLEWIEKSAVENRIVLGMGAFGQPSRFLGAFLGNRWTYVCEQPDDPSAPGQFSLPEAKSIYRLDGFHGLPRFFGVIGNPVSHSLSPQLHNALFSQHGIGDALYIPLLLDDLAPWFAFLHNTRLRFGGFSVTLPYKTRVLKYLALNESPLDSVNTLQAVPQGWKGTNTDYAGFLRPLASRMGLKGKTALVLGTGGVARTAVLALQASGCRVTAVSRSAARARELARAAGCRAAVYDDLPIKADLCVNATPVGQHPNLEDSPLNSRQLGEHRWVYDLVYRPAATSFLQMARCQGAGTISGLEMFAEQAALQFLAWAGEDPDRERIYEILSSLSLGEKLD